MTKPGPDSDYRPEYCARVIDAGKQGKSLVWISADIGVVRQTIWNWIAQNPDFAEAMTIARQASQVWWEDAGQNNLTTPGFSAPMWSRSMAARFPEDWREVKGAEISGPNGGPVQTDIKTTVDVTGLSDEQLAALASIHTC